MVHVWASFPQGKAAQQVRRVEMGLVRNHPCVHGLDCCHCKWPCIAERNLTALCHQIIYRLSGDVELTATAEEGKRGYQQTWRAIFKYLVTEWDSSLIPARQLWQSIVFQGIAGADQHVPGVTQNEEASSDFGDNTEFMNNYRMQLAQGSGETGDGAPASAALEGSSFLLRNLTLQ